ncbi:putative glycerol-3-phosphate 1-O-acyltransferase [Helianthus annuus]|nr:putative glycerol-3-phosphate 1-O-acyltransferase [Helianthus annuus]
MRRLVDHAGVVGHIYPLAILCHDIMPPPPQAKEAYSQALYDSVCDQYNVLQSAINGKKGFEASTSSISLSQTLQSL